MTGSTGLGKVIIIVMCINILLYVGGVRVIQDDGTVTCKGNDVVCNNMKKVINDTGKAVYINNGTNGIKKSVDTDFKATTSATGDESFIDNLGAVKDFIKFLVDIIFTPLGLFTGAGLPSEFTLILGIPLLTILVLGLAYFIRSGS